MEKFSEILYNNKQNILTSGKHIKEQQKIINEIQKNINEQQKIIDSHKKIIGEEQSNIDEYKKIIDEYETEDKLIKKIESRRIFFLLKDKITKECAIDYYAKFEEIVPISSKRFNAECRCDGNYSGRCKNYGHVGYYYTDLSRDQIISYMKRGKFYITFNSILVPENKAFFMCKFECDDEVNVDFPFAVDC